MADRVAVFNHGRIEQIGTPERDLRAPAHRLRRRLRRRLQRRSTPRLAAAPDSARARRSQPAAGEDRAAADGRRRRHDRRRRHGASTCSYHGAAHAARRSTLDGGGAAGDRRRRRGRAARDAGAAGCSRAACAWRRMPMRCGLTRRRPDRGRATAARRRCGALDLSLAPAAAAARCCCSCRRCSGSASSISARCSRCWSRASSRIDEFTGAGRPRARRWRPTPSCFAAGQSRHHPAHRGRWRRR